MATNIDVTPPSSKPYSDVSKHFMITTTSQDIKSEPYIDERLEDKVKSIEPRSKVDLSYWNLTDHDMSLVATQVITEKCCKNLGLCGNKIASDGISILASSLMNNSTLSSLDLSFNYVSNLGVHLLSEVLFPNHYSCLKKLFLNKNGISDEGVQSLCEMLRTNYLLTELWLSHNEIGDGGVRQLSNVLIYNNKTLKVLGLSFNIFITDLSICYLLPMLERNDRLEKLFVDNCNMTDMGKKKLEEKSHFKTTLEIKV